MLLVADCGYSLASARKGTTHENSRPGVARYAPAEPQLGGRARERRAGSAAGVPPIRFQVHDQRPQLPRAGCHPVRAGAAKGLRGAVHAGRGCLFRDLFLRHSHAGADGRAAAGRCRRDRLSGGGKRSQGRVRASAVRSHADADRSQRGRASRAGDRSRRARGGRTFSCRSSIAKSNRASPLCCPSTRIAKSCSGTLSAACSPCTCSSRVRNRSRPISR